MQIQRCRNTTGPAIPADNGEQGSDLADRLDGADFIVGIHGTDQHRLVVDQRGQGSEVNNPLLCHRHQLVVVLRGGRQYRVVLDRANQKVCAGVKSHDAVDGQVVGFTAAGCENDFGRTGAEIASNRDAGLIDCPPDIMSCLVERRRVIKLLAEIRLHGRNNLRVDRCGGGIIKIELLHC